MEGHGPVEKPKRGRGKGPGSKIRPNREQNVFFFDSDRGFFFFFHRAADVRHGRSSWNVLAEPGHVPRAEVR